MKTIHQQLKEANNSTQKSVVVNEAYDGVEIVDMTKALSKKFQRSSEEHSRAIQNMILNAYQMVNKFSDKDIERIEKALALIKNKK